MDQPFTGVWGDEARLIILEYTHAIAGIVEATPAPVEGQKREYCTEVQRKLVDLVDSTLFSFANAIERQESSIEAEFKFVLAAVADEMLLIEDWPGKEEWLNYLLESYFFRTADAGAEIFRRIDTVLNSHRENGHLAELYLILLSMGFEGQYRGKGCPPEVFSKLYIKAYGCAPKETLERQRWDPKAYAETPVQAAFSNRPATSSSVRRWCVIGTVFFIVVGYATRESILEPLMGDLRTFEKRAGLNSS